MLKIIGTGVTFKRSELDRHFPNVSAPAVLSTDDLAHLGLIEIPDPAHTAEELSSALTQAKAVKAMEINQWRASANQTSFTHSGKVIACDALSRSDIDGVAGSISLSGSFPAGFPNAWKAVDNTYLPLPTVAEFKAMYASMTLQGTVNFGHSQTLKTALAAATTVEQVNSIVW